MEGIRFVPEFAEAVRSKTLDVGVVEGLLRDLLDTPPGPESRDSASRLLAVVLYPSPRDLSEAARMMRKKAADLRSCGLGTRATRLEDDADFLERPVDTTAPATIKDIDEAARAARPRLKRIKATAPETNEGGGDAG